ncbi:NADH-quinone oxidoreductase subunit L [Miltoncostaea marina]|uniref:NADH-quinone oxidoreductase subunit L n=1 Tax=Miltoncostaea marina TaxID=2843215 RepID=UPI001C3C73C6|nr:NADH-quinone oxidoreductase subunit L [Miltoncostaea marina]
MLAWLVLGLPLLACLVLSLWPGEPDRRVTRVVGVGLPAIGFALTLVIFGILLGRDAGDRDHVTTLWGWVRSDGLDIDLALLVDPLSVLMMLVVTGVGSLIVLYSAEYMEHDRDYRRFFAEMNFFLFAMLLLVEAANFFFLIVGWGLVGLASYLLIGYYHDRPSAVAAAKKAFVINVIGDIGMILAAFLLVRELGTLDYAGVFAAAPEGLGQGTGVAEAVALLLFVGAAAKSAQIPLHTWLPDAMEGPTPVSALIHAATMVTAGVYMIVRSNVLYELAPYAGDLVAIVGALTLFVAATIALVQEDIKRVLAWSTVSQIGYMIMGAGLGAYGSSMFHFLTHAFFKALLFLAVGIAIHALAGEQSLDRMGGLRRHLRLTHVAVLVGCLAIAGIPPFSGFFSKDEILATALDAGPLGVVLAIVGLVGAGLTAFYMFRLLFRAFWGPEPQGGYAHAPHAPSWVMSAPVVVLAVLAAVGGLLQVPGAWHPLDGWLEPALLADPGLEPSVTGEVVVSVVSVLLAAAGIALAWWVFVADPARRTRLLPAPALRGLLADQYRFDEVFEEAVVQPGRDLGDTLTRDVERVGVQGAVEGTVRSLIGTARGLSVLQSGLVRSYAFAMVAGVAVLGAVLAVAVR